MTTLDLLILAGSAVLLISAIVCAVIGWRVESRLLAIQSTATSNVIQVHDLFQQMRVGGAAFGQICEVVGVVESNETLTSPMSGQPCVAYRYTRTDEEWGRTNTGRTRRDADMRGMVLQNRFTEHDERCVKSFWVRDTTGRILVDPTQAELDLRETDQRYDETLSALGNSERRVWHEEWALPIGHPVYVLGALVNYDNAPMITRHPLDRGQRFLISYRSEEQLQRTTRRRAYKYYFAAGITGGMAVLSLVWGFVL
jgi:hypothetical protein